MTFKIGYGFDWAVICHQNHFGFGLRRLDAHVQQISPGSLGKDWRNIPGTAEINTANV